MAPPSSQTLIISIGSGTRVAMTAGVRKMPDPIVMPTTMPMELKRPSRLASCACAGADARVVMGEAYQTLRILRRQDRWVQVRSEGPHIIRDLSIHADQLIRRSAMMSRSFPIALILLATTQPTWTQQPRVHDLALAPAHVHWGYYDSRITPVLRIAPGDRVRVQTMVAGGLQRIRLAGAAESEIPD